MSSILSSPFLNLRTIDQLLASLERESSTSSKETNEQRIQLLSAKVHLLVKELPSILSARSTSASASASPGPRAVGVGVDTGTGAGSEGSSVTRTRKGSGSGSVEHDRQAESSVHLTPSQIRGPGGRAQRDPASSSSYPPSAPTSSSDPAPSPPTRDAKLFEISLVRHSLARLYLVPPAQYVQAECELSIVEKDCRYILKRCDGAGAGAGRGWVQRVMRLREEAVRGLVDVESGLGREKRAERWRKVLAEIEAEQRGPCKERFVGNEQVTMSSEAQGEHVARAGQGRA